MFNAAKKITIILLLVKLIGVLKQSIIAYYFGATEATDIYLLVSQLVENLGMVLFSSIAITFLTLYTEIKETQEIKAKNLFFSTTFFYGIPITIILGVLVYLFSDQVAFLIAPGYTGDSAATVSYYLKILSIGVTMMFISAVFRSVLNAEKQFIPPKLEGVIKSLLAIGACFIWGHSGEIDYLVYSVLAYFVVSSVYLLICIIVKTDVKFTFPKKDPKIKMLLILSIPLFISNGSVYLNNVISKAIGSTLDSGSISILTYCGVITSSIHSVLIGSLTTVLLTYFSSYVIKKEMHILKEKLVSSIRVIVIAMSFVAIMIFVCAEEIIELFYGRGAFEDNLIHTSAVVLIINGVGLLFLGVRDILIYTHYSFNANSEAMKNGIIGIGINVVLSFLLANWIGVYGIAIATLIGYVITMVLSTISIKKYINIRFVESFKNIFFVMIIQLILIIIMGTIIDRLGIIDNWLVGLFIKGVMGSIIFMLILFISKNEELQEIINKVKQIRRDKDEKQ